MARDDPSDMDMETSGEQQTSQLVDRRSQEEYEKLRNARIEDEKKLEKSKKAEDSFVEQLLSQCFSGLSGTQSSFSNSQSSCQRCQQDQEHRQRMEEMKETHKELRKERSALENKQKELRSIKNKSSSNRQSSCQRCEQKDLEHREMEKIVKSYKEELAKERSALKEKEEELRSFKSRVAQSRAPRPDNVEDMSSPVNQSRLEELYIELRFSKWTDYPGRQQGQRKLKKEDIQKVFKAAVTNVNNIKQSITAVYVAEDTSPQVEKFRQTALENLQLTLYHSNKEDVFKTVFPQSSKGPAELQLASECYWLGCLLELHSPPLLLHWDQRGLTDQDPFPEFKQTKAGK